MIFSHGFMPPEIVLPITSPETEWVRGRPLIKVSPTGDHACVQLAFGSALLSWVAGRGKVGTEWRFRVEPPGEPRRPLVPDIAFVAGEKLRGKTTEELQAPAFSPTVAVEVLSPGDSMRDIADKIDVYLRSGSRLVIIVDPLRRTFAFHDAAAVTIFAGSDELRHEALPEFRLAVDRFFEGALSSGIA